MNIEFINERNAFHNYGHFTHDNLIHLFTMLKEENLLNSKNTLYLNPQLYKWHFILQHLDINIKYKKCDNPDIILDNPLNIFRKYKIDKRPSFNWSFNHIEKILEENISPEINNACKMFLKSANYKDDIAYYYSKKLKITLNENSKNVLIIHRDPIKDRRCIINDNEFYDQIKNYFDNIGFKVYIVNFSEISFEQQINYVNKCSIIIGYFGAGFSNTLYCKNNPYVIEILPSNWSYASHYQWSNTENYKMINIKKENSICTDRIRKIYKKNGHGIYPESRDQDSYVYLSDLKDLLDNITNKIK